MGSMFSSSSKEEPDEDSSGEEDEEQDEEQDEEPSDTPSPTSSVHSTPDRGLPSGMSLPTKEQLSEYMVRTNKKDAAIAAEVGVVSSTINKFRHHGTVGRVAGPKLAKWWSNLPENAGLKKEEIPAPKAVEGYLYILEDHTKSDMQEAGRKVIKFGFSENAIRNYKQLCRGNPDLVVHMILRSPNYETVETVAHDLLRANKDMSWEYVSGSEAARTSNTACEWFVVDSFDYVERVMLEAKMKTLVL